MRSYSNVRGLVWLLLGCSAGFSETVPATRTIELYLARYQSTCPLGDQASEGQAMEVQIEASLPKLKKEGTMDGVKVHFGVGQRRLPVPSLHG